MVKDLLPLYHDDACSDSSKKIIEEHLSECDSCKSTMNKIEKDIEHHTKSIKRKSMIASISIASVYALAIVVCFIVNIATGHALDWFFIVLTALMVSASVTIVPLVVKSNKILWTLGSFTITLLVLLLTCCLYSGGDWFFVAASSVILGLSVIFLPYVINQIPLKGFASRNKGLIIMLVNTILLYIVILACGYYSSSDDYWKNAFSITTVNVILVWILFLIIRYLRVDGFIKSGICVIISGIYIAVINDIINWIIEGVMHISLLDANLSIWNNNTTINANSYLLNLLVGCIVGVILLVVGLLRSGRKSKQ